jgi:tyrosine-protein kinase Etk/Wzc
MNDTLTLTAESRFTTVIAESQPDRMLLWDWLSLLKAKRNFVLSVALSGGLLTGIYAFRMKPIFTATAVIMPPQQGQSAATAMLGQLAPLAALSGHDIGMKSPSDIYIGMLRSRTIADDVIAKFKLQARYHAKDLTTTRLQLSSRTQITTGKDTMIRISVDDENPQASAELANAYVDELHAQNSRLALSESADRQSFFDAQLQSERNALAQAENELRKTQQTTGMVQVNSQVDATFKSIAQLRGEMTVKEAELQRLRQSATADHPEVVRLQAEIGVLRSQLARLEESGRQKDALVSVAQMPSAGLEYLRKLREVKYHEAVMETLAKQYEAARLDVSKEAPVIQVVDKAIPPERKTRPHRLQMAMIGTILFGLLACALVLARQGFATVSKLI